MLLFAESSDAVQIITAVVAMFGTMFSGFIAFLIAQLNSKAADAAKEAQEVKANLKETAGATGQKLDDIAKVGEKNHVLLNSNMGAALKLTAELSRWKADQTKADEDETAARVAEQNYREHLGKQATVDAKEGRCGSDDPDHDCGRGVGIVAEGQEGLAEGASGGRRG
jgi:hypothetical protein